jgi:hypothetical protein
MPSEHVNKKARPAHCAQDRTFGSGVVRSVTGQGTLGLYAQLREGIQGPRKINYGFDVLPSPLARGFAAYLIL